MDSSGPSQIEAETPSRTGATRFSRPSGSKSCFATCSSRLSRQTTNDQRSAKRSTSHSYHRHLLVMSASKRKALENAALQRCAFDAWLRLLPFANSRRTDGNNRDRADPLRSHTFELITLSHAGRHRHGVITQDAIGTEPSLSATPERSSRLRTRPVEQPPRARHMSSQRPKPPPRRRSRRHRPAPGAGPRRTDGHANGRTTGLHPNGPLNSDQSGQLTQTWPIGGLRRSLANRLGMSSASWLGAQLKLDSRGIRG